MKLSFAGTIEEWNTIMSTINDLSAAADSLDSAITSFESDVSAVVAALATAKANGGLSPADQAALDAAVGKLTADSASVSTADAAAQAALGTTPPTAGGSAVGTITPPFGA